MILSAHPFSIGDFIEVGGTSGTVHEISLNHTKLITADGSLIMLPNKELANSKMLNYTVLGRRRITRTITASYDAPTDVVKAACYQALERTPGILEDPAPSVYLTDYQSSAIQYTIYCWSTPEDFLNVSFTLGEALRDTFQEAHVEMTYDHLNIHIIEDSDKKIHSPVATTMSPERTSRSMPPQVPVRRKVSAPQWCSSSKAMAAEGPPIPVEQTVTFSPRRVPVQTLYSRFSATCWASSSRAAMLGTRPGSPGRMQ